MKKKIISILLATLSTLMLFGCGAKGTATTENGETANVEISEKKVAKADTVSEFFSKGKRWACKASSYSKEAHLFEIYFFEDGKVTVFPGDAYGCTLGDLAQMSDKEIWDKYEEVRETYKTTYLESKKPSEKSVEEIQPTIEFLNQLNGMSLEELEEELGSNEELQEKFYEASEVVSSVLDVYLEGYFSEASYGTGCVDFTEVIDKLNILINSNITFSGPFYDHPVKYVVITDGTGNATKDEYIYYDSSYEGIDDEGNYYLDKGYSTVNHFDTTRGGIGGEVQIYDKTIFYYAITDGDYFCTTETIQLDDPKSKNCLVDPSDEEKEAMFNDIQ